MGLKLYSERYGKSAKKHEQTLEKSKLYSGEQLMAMQSESFVKLARSAISGTTYYRDWAKQNRITVDDIKSLKDIQRFPVIDKSVIKLDPAQFVIGGEAALPKLMCLHTSGTTGSPLSIYCSKDDRTFHYAFFTRLRKKYGVTCASRRATLFGRIIMLSEQTKPPFWRYDAIQKNLLMSSYHLGDANLHHYYEKLIAYKPDDFYLPV
jgi:phenylacetate-CoA ligase